MAVEVGLEEDLLALDGLMPSRSRARRTPSARSRVLTKATRATPVSTVAVGPGGTGGEICTAGVAAGRTVGEGSGAGVALGEGVGDGVEVGIEVGVTAGLSDTPGTLP